MGGVGWRLWVYLCPRRRRQRPKVLPVAAPVGREMGVGLGRQGQQWIRVEDTTAAGWRGSGGGGRCAPGRGPHEGKGVWRGGSALCRGRARLGAQTVAAGRAANASSPGDPSDVTLVMLSLRRSTSSFFPQKVSNSHKK